MDCGLRIRNFFMVIGCEAELYLHKLQAKTKRVSELTRSVSERCQSRLTWSRACVPDTCIAHFGRTCTGLDSVSGDPRACRAAGVVGGRDEQQANQPAPIWGDGWVLFFVCPIITVSFFFLYGHAQQGARP